MNQAYFVMHPTTYKDLHPPYKHGSRCPFRIAKAVKLSSLDYENFVFGLDADRQCIEDNAHLCSDGETKDCLLIKSDGRSGGILALPDPRNPSFILMAAIYPYEI